MKLTVFLLLLSVISVFAGKSYSQTKELNLNMKNSSVKEVLRNIEEQSEFVFMYSEKLVDVNREVSVNVKNQKINEVLDELFAGTDVNYKVRDRFILLTTPEVYETDLMVQQQRTVSGTVTDEEGEPLPGVTVVVKGSTQGTVTDVNGEYSLANIPEDATLVFSFVGMRTQEMEVGNQTSINVTMEQETIGIEEVVAVGYGTVRRGDLTGSVSSIDAALIEERGTTNPIQSLQGSVAGVQIKSRTGTVGESFSVQIRGKNTFSSAVEPLYVVDGAIVNNIDFLNPQDIEKIDILKDASSVAIYGSRGSNGVVIIQTKGGEGIAGTTISVDSYYGIKNPARIPKTANAQQYLNHRKAVFYGIINDPESWTSEEFYDRYAPPEQVVTRQRYEDLEYYDWRDALIKDGYQTNNNITVTHNDGASSYVLGLGYQDETGLVKKEGIKKYTLHGSINQKVSDKFTASLSTHLSFSDRQVGSDGAMDEAFNMHGVMNPWAIDADNNPIVGEYNNLPGKLYNPVTGVRVLNFTSTFNPILQIENTDNEFRSWTNTVNASLKYDVLPWLAATSSLSAYVTNINEGTFYGRRTGQSYSDDKARSYKNHTERFRYSWDNQVNLNKKIDKHSFNFLALQSLYINRQERSNLGSRKQPFETGFYNIGSGDSETFNVGSSFNKNQLLSYAMRLNYSYGGKYLLTLTNRWDGASEFPKGNKWSSFPSLAVAWRLIEESFLSQSQNISNLKLRISFGQTGNNAVSSYATINNLTNQAYYNYGSTSANGWYTSSIANKTLQWEKTKEINFGIDYGFFRNRINGSLDYYNRLSDHLLVSQKLPIETGFGSMDANAGSVRNKGFEIVLNTVNIANNLVQWSTDFNFSHNANTIESIYGQSEVDDIGNNLFIGQSIDVLYNYKMIGVWQPDQAAEAAVYNQKPGEARVLDVNGDDKITPEEDRAFLGSSNPSWSYGATSRLRVADFDLNVALYGVTDVFVQSPWHAKYYNPHGSATTTGVFDFYMPENRHGIPVSYSNTFPQPRLEGQYWNDNGVGYYRDASYLKIQNITLGYSFPERIINKFKMKQLRLYVNVINPFVFTEYGGLDPEWATAHQSVGRVSSITTQFGLNVKF